MTWISVLQSIVIASIISIGFTFFLLKKNNEALSGVVRENLKVAEDSINEQLKPILDTNSRVMGIISQKGAQVRNEKKAMQILGDDIVNQNELMISAVETVSPKLAEHLRENPEQILSLMPRLQGIADKLGLDLGQFSLSPSPRTSSPHPFGLREE